MWGCLRTQLITSSSENLLGQRQTAPIVSLIYGYFDSSSLFLSARLLVCQAFRTGNIIAIQRNSTMLLKLDMERHKNPLMGTH